MRKPYKYLIPAIMLSLIPTSGCGLISAIVKPIAETDAKSNSQTNPQAKSNSPANSQARTNSPAKANSSNTQTEQEQIEQEINSDIDNCVNYEYYKNKYKGINTLHCTILLNLDHYKNRKIAKTIRDQKIKKLLASGDDVNAYFIPDYRPVEYYTPIDLAVLGKYLAGEFHHGSVDPDLVKLLIESGADVNGGYKYNKAQETPLHIAVKEGNVDIINLLLDAGADVNAVVTDYNTSYNTSPVTMEMTPLSVAITSGKQANIVQLLLNAGADANVVLYGKYQDRGRFLATPLSILLKSNIDNMNAANVKLLLDAGADVTILLSSYGETPFYIAAENASTNFANSTEGKKSREKTQRILRQFLARTNVTEISKQVDWCIGNKPIHEAAEWMAINMTDRNVDIEAYKRTKDYADWVESIYRDMNNIDYAKRRRICSVAVASAHNTSEQLPFIFNYCNGVMTALAGGICQDTPKQVLEGVTSGCPTEYGCSGSACNRQPSYLIRNFVECIGEFQVTKDDYVASSEFFTEQMQKIMDDNAKQTKAVREGRKEADKKAYQNFIYLNSPRGKCETRCNNEYKKNTDSWNSCMRICKDKRSDVLE